MFIPRLPEFARGFRKIEAIAKKCEKFLIQKGQNSSYTSRKTKHSRKCRIVTS
jgi:hypothetical protein